MTLDDPVTGFPWFPRFRASILAAFKQRMSAPLWLWGAPTANLPTTASLGANEGALAYDDTLNTLTFFNGAAWLAAFGVGASAADARTNLGLVAGGAGDIWVEKAGDTMTGSLGASFDQSASPGFESINTAAMAAGAGGIIRVRPSGKPTASGQRLGVLQFSAPDSSAVIQSAASVEAFATEDWGTLAGEGAELRFGVTANGALSRTMVAAVTPTGVEPVTDNTFYLGRNDDDAPKAWKGLILHDSGNGKTYRIEMVSGTLTATDLTD